MKIKEFVKQYMIGLILSFLVCVVTVSAITYFDSKNVTYSNETTGMASTNVQDAVNELYNVCFPPTIGDQILEDVPIVSSGDGLYKDEYEEGRYIYKGKNVNNYITFNNETWRIVSIEPDKTIKIMKEASIGNMEWDSLNLNNWNRPATLNEYLNGIYLTGTLNSTAQSQIVPKDWNIGAINYAESNMSTQINKEKATTWNGKVALITVSEYIRSNSNQSSCGTFNLNASYYNNCQNTTWMQNSSIYYWWTLSPDASSSDTVFRVFSDGNVYDYVTGNAHTNPVRPAVYLSSSVQITGGNGSSSSPYTLG